MRRAALSVVSNVGEGFEHGGNREFLNFLSITKRSIGELKAQAYMAADAPPLFPRISVPSWFRRQTASVPLRRGLIRFLQSTEMKGATWKSDHAARRLREVSASYYVPAAPGDHTPLDIPADHFTEQKILPPMCQPGPEPRT